MAAWNLVSKFIGERIVVRWFLNVRNIGDGGRILDHRVTETDKNERIILLKELSVESLKISNKVTYE